MLIEARPDFCPRNSPLRSFLEYTSSDKDAAEFWEELFCIPCLYISPDGVSVLSTGKAVWDFMESHSRLFLSETEYDRKLVSHKFHRLNDLTIIDSQLWATVTDFDQQSSDKEPRHFEEFRYAAILRYNGRRWKICSLMYLDKCQMYEKQYCEGEKSWEIVM